MAIQLQDLINAKKTYGFSWYWTGSELPPKKNTGRGSHAYFELSCGKCHKKKWVEWSPLSKGKNHACRSCAKLPTLEKMKEIAKKYQMLWLPTMQFKSDPKTKRRVYKMRCSGCFGDFWVRWNHYQQGRSKGCGGCLKRLSAGSLKDTSKYYKSPLRQEWRRLGLYKGLERYKDKFHWQTFEEFEKWALANNYNQYETPRLTRKINKDGFTPENCYWKPTAQPGIILPSGKTNYDQRFS